MVKNIGLAEYNIWQNIEQYDMIYPNIFRFHGVIYESSPPLRSHQKQVYGSLVDLRLFYMSISLQYRWLTEMMDNGNNAVSTLYKVYTLCSTTDIRVYAKNVDLPNILFFLPS